MAKSRPIIDPKPPDTPRERSGEKQPVADQSIEIGLLATAMSNLGEGVMITTDEFKSPGPKIVYVNDAMCRITGYAVEQLVGQTPRILQGEETDKKTITQLRQSLSEKRLHLCELVNYRKDGTPYNAELFITPLFDDAGIHTHFIAIHRDITERKRGDDALRRMSKVYTESANAIFIKDLSGRIIDLNQAAEEQYGWTRDELIGKSIDMLVPPTDQQQREVLMARCIRGEKVRGVEVSRVRKDGGVLNVLLTLSLLTDDEGRPTGVASISDDITRRKQAEQAVHDRESRLQAVLNTAADAIINIDERGIIIELNPATERMFGYTRDELVGRNVKILMPAPYHDEHDGYIARYRETGEPRIIGTGRDVVGRRKDDSTFPISRAVSEASHLGLFTGIVRDITDQVVAQQKLLQAERLAAIGEAMAGLAHESRNALQRSQAGVDLLLDQLEDQPESLELLKAIQRAQDDLHRLYEEVRAYAAPIQLRPLDRHVGEVVREAWDDLTASRHEHDARFEQHSACDDLHCHIDPFAIGQVFRNILENAVQACSDPIAIQVAYSDANHSAAQALRITIRDNGPGLLREHAERVFDSFFTTKTQGTGLGMAIAKRIVQAHGGEIVVNPDCQQGAEFIVTLLRKQP